MTAQPIEQDIHADYKIQNVVATATIEVDEKLDLVKIHGAVDGTEYNPERFPGVIMKLENPRASILVFSTGKMVITGMRAEADVKDVMANLTKQLKKAKIPVKNPKTEIVNIVASGKLDMRIDLNLASLLLKNAMFEPEVFPGLIYRIQDPRAVFLLFSTGAFVCTGVNRAALVKDAVEKLLEKMVDLKEKANDSDVPGEDEYVFL